VALEERDLVLEGGVGGICCLGGQGEVIVQMARAEIGGGLGDEFRALHVLSIPEGGSILIYC
jgi:hypothetical protein